MNRQDNDMPFMLKYENIAWYEEERFVSLTGAFIL